MNPKLILAAALLGTSALAHAAPPVFLTLDHSTESLVDKAAAAEVWKTQLTDKLVPRLAKLYKPARLAFLSQVEGGFTEGKTCVVTARVALVPRSGKSAVFTPAKMATAFDAQANVTQQQCKDLGKAKLGEAITAVMSSLVAAK